MILQILTLLGAVTLFLFGLSLLSGGLQKVAGDGLRSFLASMTSNPFKQIITGKPSSRKTNFTPPQHENSIPVHLLPLPGRHRPVQRPPL